MPQVSYPGVYIQEKSSGVKTITGVATSIGAFFGRSVKGPLDKAVRCLSFADFVRNFGPPHPLSDLSNSVRQFFDNGGSDCYVVRLAHGARRAGVDLENWAGTVVLRATAKMDGLWGNGARLEVDYNTPNPGETFNLRVTQEEGGRVVATELHQNLSMDPASSRHAPAFVTQGSQLIDLALDATVDLNSGSFSGFSEARRPMGADLAGIQGVLGPLINFGNPSGARRFDISVNGSAYVTVDVTTWNVNDPGVTAVTDVQNQLADRINQALNVLVPAPTVSVTLNPTGGAGTQRLLRITANNGDRASVRVRRSAASDLSAALMLGVDNGGVELARRSDYRPAASGTVLRIGDGTGSLARLNAFLDLQQQHLQSITIDTEVVPLNAAPYDLRTTAPADPFYGDGLAGASPSEHHDGVREKLRIIAQAISNNPNLNYKAELHGYQLAILAKSGPYNQQPTVTLQFAGGAPAGATAALTGAIQVNTRQYTLGPGNASPFTTFNAAAQTGDDGTAPQFADYVGNPTDQTGFHALDPHDLFNLMVLPADAELTDADRQNLWGPASIYCQSRRAFLLIDAPDGWATTDGRAAIVQNTAQVNDLRARVVKDHSAVFYPKLLYNDRGVLRAMGAAGAVAGLLARIDASRGVWKAAAGTEADVRGIAGLHVKLTDLENGVLNKLGVNCLRSFPTGFVNWGARTLDGSDDIGSEWKYIPIRRLALFIEESLYRGTKWVVFEPNDEPLWAKIRLNVGVFMNGLFRQGAFQGSTPDQAFYVKCDAETTTQADRNLGIVNIEVGFAPLKPAEFVIITIQQIAGDLQ